MNRKQWYVLTIASFLFGMFFISIDTSSTSCLGFFTETINFSDIWCVINAEMYEPFIYLFNLGWIVFLICAWLEPKN